MSPGIDLELLGYEASRRYIFNRKALVQQVSYWTRSYRYMALYLVSQDRVCGTQNGHLDEICQAVTQKDRYNLHIPET